jgi:hypothetical protein
MVTIYRRPSCSGHCTLPRQAAARIAIQLTYRWRERDANGCVRGTCQSDAQESACPRQGDHQDVAYRHGLQQIAGLRGHVARVHIGCRTTEQGGTSRVRAPLAAEAERAQREELDGPDGHAVSWSASRASRPHGGAARAGAEETRRTNHRGDDPLERRRRPADPERGSFQSSHARSSERLASARVAGAHSSGHTSIRASGSPGRDHPQLLLPPPPPPLLPLLPLLPPPPVVMLCVAAGVDPDPLLPLAPPTTVRASTTATTTTTSTLREAIHALLRPAGLVFMSSPPCVIRTRPSDPFVSNGLRSVVTIGSRYVLKKIVGLLARSSRDTHGETC